MSNAPAPEPRDAGRRPVIGVVTGEVRATYGPWRERSVLAPSAYLRSVEHAGGLPLVVAPVAGSVEQLSTLLDGCLLTGGADVDSARYGQPRHAESQRPDTGRDAFELALLEQAKRIELPVLAICRGVQVMNVWRGGSLHQHLPDVGADRAHLAVPGAYGTHPVTIDPASRLGQILGRRDAAVPSHHHQAVAEVGRGLVASAWAPDGTVEGLEDPAADFLVGVQWHPEVGEDLSLFEALVAAAAARSARPG